MLQTTLLTVMSAVVGGIEIPVTEGPQSQIEVELCVLEVCDSDTSPITGSWEIGLDCPEAPGLLTMQDFNLNTSQTLDFVLDYGILGEIVADATGLTLTHGDPGPHNPAVAIEAGVFALVDVPVNMNGVVAYEASGVICNLIMGQGLPCTDTVDLSAIGTVIADTVDGQIAVVGENIVLSGIVPFDEFIDPLNPDLGTISGLAEAEGQTAIPQRGDLDFNGTIDLADHALYASCAAGPNVPQPIECTPGNSADADCDGDGDLADFAELQIGVLP